MVTVCAGGDGGDGSIGRWRSQMSTGAPDPNAIATAESLRQKLLMAVSF